MIYPRIYFLAHLAFGIVPDFAFLPLQGLFSVKPLVLLSSCCFPEQVGR